MLKYFWKCNTWWSCFILFFFCYLQIYLHIYVLFWTSSYTYNSLVLSFRVPLSLSHPAYVIAVQSITFLQIFFLLYCISVVYSSLYYFWKLILFIFGLLNAKNIMQAVYILYKTFFWFKKIGPTQFFLIDNSIFLLEGTISLSIFSYFVFLIIPFQINSILLSPTFTWDSMFPFHHIFSPTVSIC